MAIVRAFLLLEIIKSQFFEAYSWPPRKRVSALPAPRSSIPGAAPDRMMSGANYHISYLQILESERRLKVSNILKLFSSQTVFSMSSLQEFIKSFSSVDSKDFNNEVDLDPFLSTVSDLSAIECTIQELQSLAFIAGYSIHQYLKRSQPCRLCRDFLTVDKDLIIDDLSISQFKLLDLSDRGCLK